MRPTALLAFAALSLLETTQAIQLIERRDSDARVFGIDIQRRQVEDPALRDRLRRRQSKTVTQVLDNQV
jgi:hypothetical protein